jgi:plasmid stabilization system protein ParE
VPAVVLLARAEVQIIDVLAYTFEHFGDRKYLEYRALIRAAIEVLEGDPRTGKRRPDIHPDAWTCHIARPGKKARHLFVYRIREDVEIARFLYDAMDLRQQRPEEWGEP